MRSSLLSVRWQCYPESLNPQGLCLRNRVSEKSFLRRRPVAGNNEIGREFVPVCARIPGFTQPSCIWLPIWLSLVNSGRLNRHNFCVWSFSVSTQASEMGQEWQHRVVRARASCSGAGANRACLQLQSSAKLPKECCAGAQSRKMIMTWRKPTKKKSGGKNRSRFTKHIWEGRGVKERGVLREFYILLCDSYI